MVQVKYFLCLCLLVGSFVSTMAQSVVELKEKIRAATDNEERMYLYFELAKKHRDLDERLSAAREASDLAFRLRDHDMESSTSLYLGDTYFKKRQTGNAQKAYQNALENAKKAKNIDLFIQSVDKLSDLKIRDRNYSAAYNIYKENFNFLSKSGINLLNAEKEEAAVKSRSTILSKESNRLESERKKLMDAIVSLRAKQKSLEDESNQLKSKTETLEEENKEARSVIDSTSMLIDSFSQVKLETEEFIAKKDRIIRTLNTEKEKEAFAKRQLQQELDLERLQQEKQRLVIERNKYFRYIMGVISLLILGLALSLYLRYKAKKKANLTLEQLNRDIKREQEKSEQLLLNILPEKVAEELKISNKVQAKSYEEATVLFTDFKNFTSIAEQMKPEELVADLDECFRAFDYIIAEHNIEKIKTIGDAYMCANGISDKPSNPNNVVEAALAFQKFLNDNKRKRIREGRHFFEARIGVHTGSVVAGIVGVKKFAYDIWGDTVNIASRLESSCEPGKVNISDDTYRKIKYDFDCQYRGELEVKNKGLIKMYYVEKKR